MLITLPELEIGEDEGFVAGDLFQREPFGQGLTKLMTNLDQGAVIVLDAPWGSGKTTFTRMWVGDLRKNGVAALRFDAFANDYLEDAFAALAGEVLAYAESRKPASDKHIKQFKKAALGVGKVLLRTAVKAGLKVATLGALDATDLKQLESVKDDIASELAEATEELLRERLEKHREDRQTFEDFRSALQSLVASLSKDPKKPGKLVFIIDELDRCRPDYGLRLLEVIKHFFSVPQVHFVLVTHLQQLEASVRAAYGADIDAKTYLQKFYHLVVALPSEVHGPRGMEPTVRNYLRHFAKRENLTGDDARFYETLTEFIGHVAVRKGLTLRSVERVMTYVTLALSFSSKKTLRHPSIVGGLAVMKALQPDLFVKAQAGTLTFAEVVSFFDLKGWVDESGRDRGEWHRNWWQFYTDRKIDQNEKPWSEFSASLWNYAIDDRFDAMKHLATRVMDAFLVP